MDPSNRVAQKVISLPPCQTPIEDVEQKLDQTWEGFRSGNTDDDAVTRACMSNLLIYCQSVEEAQSVRADLPSILLEHPARVLLLRKEENTDAEDLCAWVGVYCSCVGSGLQICGEEVEVACRNDADHRLPSAARSLLIGDLPVTLWWAASLPPSQAGHLFDALACVADQVIFDSAGWLNPPKDMLALARWASADRDEYVIHNLAWRRLKPWRQVLSEELDPAITPYALESASSIRIEHGPHALTAAWLLIGWLADRLAWRVEEGRMLSRSEAQWRFHAAQGTITVRVVRRPEGEAAVHLVDWHWSGAHPGRLVFELQDRRKLQVQVEDGQARGRSLPRQDRATLIAEQLAHRYRDRRFESALTASNQMTQALSR